MPTNQSLNPVILAALAITALIALVFGVWLGQPGTSPTPTSVSLNSATLFPVARALSEVTLTGHRGQDINLQTLKGRWTLLFFGYTHCPDVCPTTMAVLNNVMAKLGSQNIKHLPRVLFVSVDPNRDSPEQLARYVKYFNPDFLGATAPDDELKKLTRQLGVYYLLNNKDNPADYTVDHSSAIFLLNPKSQYQALFSAPHDAQTIAENFVTILDQYKAQP